VPPALNRFTRTLDKNMAETLFKLLLKYRPEDKAAKKERLLKAAQAREAGEQSRRSSSSAALLRCTLAVRGS
jgi:large subunit ribosomal protein L7Ae